MICLSKGKPYPSERLYEAQTIIHQKEYATTDFQRQVRNQEIGLADYEDIFINMYFKPDQSTLEIGTGGGRIAFALAQKGFTKIVAIDYVKEFIDIAELHSKKTGRNILFKQGNALDMEFSDNSFPQVIAGGVLLSHFPEKTIRTKVLHEIHRILKPDGYLIINAHNIYRDRYIGIVKKIMKFVRLFGNPYHHSENALPRLGGRDGKIDPFFFRRKKSTLYYFYPMEFFAELIQSNFSIENCNIVYRNRKPHAECNIFYAQPWLLMVCRKGKS